MRQFFPYASVMLALLLFLPGMARPQDIQVSVSQIRTLDGTMRLQKVFGHDEQYYYEIKYYGNQYFLEKLDQDLNLVTEEPIKLFKGLKTYQLETVVHFQNQLYVFCSRTRLDDITLYYQKIDKNSLRPASDLVELTTVKCVKGAWADFHFALSRYETKLLIACRTKLTWSGAQYNEFWVMGDDFNVVWKRKDTYEFRGQGPRDNLYLVDESGNVSILSLIKRESIMSLVRDKRNLYTIYRYTDQGKTFREYPVTLNEKYIRGIRIIGGEHGELICAGMYSELYKAGLRGTFYFKISTETGQIYDQTLNPFDDALLSQLAKSNEPIIKNEELVKYGITDLVLRNNGRMMMIAEQVFNQNFNTYNNLIVTCFDDNGQVYWTQVIPKSQNFAYSSIRYLDVELPDYRDYILDTGYFNSSVENYASYALLAPLDESWIMVVYNDDVRNLTATDKQWVMKRPRKSYLLAVMVDEYGTITRKPLITWKKKALFPQPIRFYDNLHNTLVIPAFRNRRFDYYKITATP